MPQNTKSGTQSEGKPYLVIGASESGKQIKLDKKDYVYIETETKGRVVTAEILYEIIFEKFKLD